MRLVPRDTYQNLFSGMKVTLKQDAFAIETMEATTSIIYWSKGELQVMPVSD